MECIWVWGLLGLGMSKWSGHRVGAEQNGGEREIVRVPDAVGVVHEASILLRTHDQRIHELLACLAGAAEEAAELRSLFVGWFGREVGEVG